MGGVGGTGAEAVVVGVDLDLEEEDLEEEDL